MGKITIIVEIFLGLQFVCLSADLFMVRGHNEMAESQGLAVTLVVFHWSWQRTLAT